MIVLLKKEISGFFSNLTGYVVILTYLTINSLFIWVIPGDNNIIQSNYASLHPFFEISPWLFLFLVPAVMMRTLSDEKKSGTIELLYTRPITELQIIISKYFAGIIIVLLSILPSLTYFFYVGYLGNPPFNLDIGGTIGAYIGLFFLASIYAAVGLFASAITDNPIVSFILAMLMCFGLYTGFDYLSNVPGLVNIADTISSMGINQHYKSLSRGVIDSRDIIYFLSTISVFILCSKTVLESRKW